MRTSPNGQGGRRNAKRMQQDSIHKLQQTQQHGGDAEHNVLQLTRKHFGEPDQWTPTVRQYVHELQRALRKGGLRFSSGSAEVCDDILPSELQCEELQTIRNLQNLVVRLRREADGSIVYTLREGRLAGADTTAMVRNKTLQEYLGEETLAVILPYIKRAFEGETVHLETEMGGRTYVRHYSPIVDEHSHEIREVVGSLTDISTQKEVESQLRSSEHLFRMVIDNVPVGILKQEVHADGRVHNEVVNNEFQRISGYSVEELWNMTAEQRNDMTHRDDREYVNSRWAAWMAENDDSTLRLTYRFQHRSGTYRTFQNFMVKFRSEEGNLVFVQAVSDITSTVEREKQLRHLASYLEQSVTPILEVNDSGEVSYMNEAANREFKKVLELGTKHPLLAGFEQWREELRTTPSQLLKRMISVNLNYYEQHIHFMPEAKVYRVFCHNVTTMKLAEEELRESLEKERALSLLRSTFLDTISHEFRTPLTGISISAELMQRYDASMEAKERAQHVQAIRDRVQELVQLVARFTTQSNLHTMRDSFRPQALNVVPVLKKILEEVRSAVVDRKQKLVYELPGESIMVSGDERLLRHAVRNILLNAVQYSPEQSAIQIRLHQSADDLFVTIIDEGIGIPEKEIDRLFTPYFRGSNANKVSGSGLGISIAKEFIELHGGSVEISSRMGIGTTVNIRLPLYRETGAAVQDDDTPKKDVPSDATEA